MTKLCIHRNYDQMTGITEEVWTEPSSTPGKTIVTRKAYKDLDRMNAIRHEARAAAPKSFRNDDGMYLAAVVDPIEITEWKDKHGFDWHQSTDNEKKSWLNKRAPQTKARNVKV